MTTLTAMRTVSSVRREAAFDPADGLAAGLLQRGQLLDRLGADLQGSQTVVARGALPAILADGLAMSDIHHVRVDVVHCPDGAWRVAGQSVPSAPVLAVFLPAICRLLLGETLLLPSIPSLWLADAGALVCAVNDRRWQIGHALEADAPIHLDTLDRRIDLQSKIAAAPWRYMASIRPPGPGLRIDLIRAHGKWSVRRRFEFNGFVRAQPLHSFLPAPLESSGA